MEKSNLNVDFLVIWLDRDIEKTKDSRESKGRIRHAVRNQLKTFDDPDECVNYMLEHCTKRIFFIVSGSFGYYLVNLIYHLPQIHRIYVYCANRQRAESWAKTELKISGIFTKSKTLIEKLCDDMQSCDDNSRLPMSIFHLAEREKSLRNLTEDSITFTWYQLLLVVLQRLACLHNSKTDMIQECRAAYQNDPTEQEKIDKFEKDYRPARAIWWYTSDCFIYRLLNQALRTQDIDIIFHFRFFIHDLNNQIKQLYRLYLQKHQPIENHQLQVYRGQKLSLDELNSIRANINGIISMNTFLSATLNRDLALIYSETNQPFSPTSNVQPVLFTITICDMSEKTAPFALIKTFSCYTEEDEVLFTLSAIFQVRSVELKDDLWHVHLQLSKEQNQLCQHLSKDILKKIGSSVCPLTLGWFLFRMNEFSKAEHYAEALLKQLSNSDREKGNTYNLLGLICYDTGRIELAIEYYGKALENYARTSQPDNPHVTACHYNLGLAYLKFGNVERAHEHEIQAKQTLINSSRKQNPSLETMTESLQAKIESEEGNYAKAIELLENVLQKKRKNLSPVNSSIATTLKELGIVHMKMNNNKQALKYLEEAFRLNKKLLASNHLDFADLHRNIGIVHFNCADYPRALENFQQAVDIIIDVTRENVDAVDELMNLIDKTKQKMNEQQGKN